MKYTKSNWIVLLSFMIVTAMSWASEPSLRYSDDFDFLKNRRKKYPLGVNIGVLGLTGWGHVSVDWFIISKIDIEAGIGIQTKGIHPFSYFAGFKYHVLGKSPTNLTPYFGIYDAFFVKDGKLYQHNLYFPIGIHKIKRDRFTWAIELAYQFNKYTDRNIWGSFKVGYRIL